MVSRLYPSTRKLWEQTRSILIALGKGGRADWWS